MAVAATSKIAAHIMVAVFFRQCLIFLQCFQHGIKFIRQQKLPVLPF